MLRNKKIVLCVTGGIAAYKCPHLVRLLVREGATVRVAMTGSAQRFVTPETLSVVSRNPVWKDFFDSDHNWHNHVELGEWADLVLVAPLTANTLARMVTGACDNIVLAVLLSSRAPVMVAPAMDLEMYRHATVTANLATLKKRGVYLIPATHGELASGLVGEGRMAEPEEIVSKVKDLLGEPAAFSGRRVLVNAGPTYESIDPVRFIGNRSSGKMGVALAEAFYSAGAEVTLVLGPSAISGISEGIETIRVESSDEMHREMTSRFDGMQVTVCCAAVADYKPRVAQKDKMKKSGSRFALELEPTVDILAELGGKKKDGQVLVGFALETRDLEKYAADKLARKNLDLVVANLAGAPGSGIGADHNTVTLIDRRNKITKFELKSKQAVARDIVDYVARLLR